VVLILVHVEVCSLACFEGTKQFLSHCNRLGD
jgi:hypothetical protein